MDFETTGLNYKPKLHKSIKKLRNNACFFDCFNEVIEVGIIQFKIKDQKIIIEKVFQKLYKPHLKPIKVKEGEFNWITFPQLSKEILEEQNSILTTQNFNEFHNLLKGRIIISNYHVFEKHFIEEIYKYHNQKPILTFFDTKSETKNKIPNLLTYSLKPLTTNYFKIDFSKNQDSYHTTLFDCLASLSVFIKLNNL